MSELNTPKNETLKGALEKRGQDILDWLADMAAGDIGPMSDDQDESDRMMEIFGRVQDLVLEYQDVLDQNEPVRPFDPFPLHEPADSRESQWEKETAAFQGYKPAERSASASRIQPDSVDLPRFVAQASDDHLQVPIPVGDDVVGLFEFEDIDLTDIDPEDLQAVYDITEQVGLALENQRLFDRTQEALSEVESLYSASAGFNHAQNSDDILTTIMQTMDYAEPTGAAYWELNSDPVNNTRWLILEAVQRTLEGPSFFMKGAMFDLENYSIAEALFGRESTALLVSDLHTDPITSKDQNLLHVMDAANLKSVAFIPLMVGRRTTGLITVHWEYHYEFTDRDRQFLRTLLYHAAPAIETLKLLRTTQEEAEISSRVSQMTAALSIAEDENDILAAISEHSNLPEGHTLALSYLYSNRQGLTLDPAVEYETVCVFNDGRNITEKLDESILGRFPISHNPLSEVWSDPDEKLFHIENIDLDPRASERLRATAAAVPWKSALYVPLFSANRWQAVITLTAPEPNAFSSQLLNLAMQVSESLSALVATRRARLAQLDAQARTEFLYNIGSQINQASTDIQSIMDVVGQIVAPQEGVEKAILFTFNDIDKPNKTAAVLTGAWHSGRGTPPSPEGSLFRFSIYPSLALMLTRETSFIADTADDPRIDAKMSAIFKELEMRSLGILPLWVSGSQIGVIVLQSNEPYPFSDSEVEIFKAILPQISVAVQNKLLLEAAQKRAETERVLREVTEKVQNAPTVDLVMKAAVQEVGRVLGRKTLIYFNDASDQSDENE